MDQGERGGIPLEGQQRPSGAAEAVVSSSPLEIVAMRVRNLRLRHFGITTARTA